MLTAYSLRRRFEQNQEDCTFTVLALLPTATENIVAELETERITYELQQQKAAKLTRGGEGGVSDFGSTPPSVTDDDGRSLASLSLQSESGMHISQLGIPTAPTTTGDGVQDGGQHAAKARKSKLQLWNDLKISGTYFRIGTQIILANDFSYNASIYSYIHPCALNTAYSNSIEPSWPPQLPLKRCITGDRRLRVIHHLSRESR